MSADKKEWKYSRYFYNPLTYTGVVLALLFFIIECFLFGLDYLDKGSNVYLGIFTYIILPPFIILGLILIPTGALLKKRRRDKGLPESQVTKFQIDLTNPQHRNAFFVFLIGTSVLLVMTAIGSYKAYHHTESVLFCGVTCHGVMTPQYTTYQHSPHARVKCVDCHIGEGPDWYVRYKLEGARQLYHFVKNDYARPITIPVKTLRPPTDTCERCHWPEKFYGAKEIKKSYYSTEDPEAKNWILRMLIKVGGNNEHNEGIHAHMNMNTDVYYVAEDDGRQNISWIKSVSQDGKETIYTSPDSKYKEMTPPDDLIRKMDCLDCHNRPTHHFYPPYDLVNRAFNLGKIKSDIPGIKSKIMEFLSAEYTDKDKALGEIETKLRAYYAENHFDYYQAHKTDVEEAIVQAKKMYSDNFFPEMKTRWDNRPDHIGHLWSNGCFRCHDGAHASSENKVISKDCNICHTIIEQGPAGETTSSTNGLEFVHPFSDDGLWKESNCADCHTGS